MNEELELADRAKMVVTELELVHERQGSIPNQAVVDAVHRHSTSAQDSFQLLEAVRLELGLEWPGGKAPAWVRPTRLGQLARAIRRFLHHVV